MIVALFGLEDRYEISGRGEIFAKAATRKRSDGVVRTLQQRRIKTKLNEFGYEVVKLYNGINSETRKVHRLVLLSFDWRQDAESLDVNHLDGVKDHNHRTNLEWATRSQNLKHSYDVLGRVGATTGKFGKDHHRAKSVTATANGTVVHTFNSLMDAQRAGFNASHISRCIAGKRNKHRGLEWSSP